MIKIIGRNFDGGVMLRLWCIENSIDPNLLVPLKHAPSQETL